MYIAYQFKYKYCSDNKINKILLSFLREDRNRYKRFPFIPFCNNGETWSQDAPSLATLIMGGMRREVIRDMEGELIGWNEEYPLSRPTL